MTIASGDREGGVHPPLWPVTHQRRSPGREPNWDYALPLPAAKDTSLAALPRKKLEAGSSELAGDELTRPS